MASTAASSGPWQIPFAASNSVSAAQDRIDRTGRYAATGHVAGLGCWWWFVGVFGTMLKAEEMLCTAKGAELYTASYFHPRPRAIVIVAHSFTDRTGQYDALVQALWNAGFSVYLFNWRHQITTERQKGKAQCLTHMDQAVGDFALVVEQAKSRETTKRAFVVAHDEGAAVCLSCCASGAVSDVEGVVLFTPLLIPPTPVSCTELGSLLLSVILPKWKLTVMHRGVTDTMALRDFRLCISVARDARSKMTQMQIPIFVVYGTEDSSEDVAASHLAIEQTTSANKDIVEVHGRTADLWSGRETANECCFEKVVQWLTERL